jgi:hypothetical protein
MKTQNYKLLYQNKFLYNGTAFSINRACKLMQLYRYIDADSVVFVPGTGLYDINNNEIFEVISYFFEYINGN